MSVREYKTPREITILLRSRDGWTIPQIAEISMTTRDELAVYLERWEGIPGELAAEAVKLIRTRKDSPPITGMSMADLASVCRIPYQMALRWATVPERRGRQARGPIVLSCAVVGEILRERHRHVSESNAVEAWFRRHGLPADCGD